MNADHCGGAKAAASGIAECRSLRAAFRPRLVLAKPVLLLGEPYGLRESDLLIRRSFMVFASASRPTIPRNTVANPSEVQNRYTFRPMKPVLAATVTAFSCSAAFLIFA